MNIEIYNLCFLLISDFPIIFIYFKKMIFLLSKLFLTCKNYSLQQ